MDITARNLRIVRLNKTEVFEITALSSYAGVLTRAQIDRIEIVTSDLDFLGWSLFGHKVKKDGTVSTVAFEFNPWGDEGDAVVWASIPAEIRHRLPDNQRIEAQYS